MKAVSIMDHKDKMPTYQLANTKPRTRRTTSRSSRGKMTRAAATKAAVMPKGSPVVHQS